MLTAFPQSARQIRAPADIPCLNVAWRTQWRLVLFSFSFPPFDTFLKSNLMSILSAAKAALPQSIKGTRACHHHLHPGGVWRRPWYWVFLFSLFQMLSRRIFSVKLLFNRWQVLIFLIFTPPPHLNFSMSYVPTKICLPKLAFCVVN